MRQNIKDFVSIVSKQLPIIEPIYEFGSFQVSEQIGLADLRPLFPEKEFVGCDMRAGPGRCSGCKSSPKFIKEKFTSEQHITNAHAAICKHYEKSPIASTESRSRC